MTTNIARLEFAPPPTPGSLRALGLAIAAHALLLAVLAIGVQWKRDPTPVTVEAELWSTLPEQAAPPPVAPALPVETPVPLPAPLPPTPAPDPAIAIEKENARLKIEKVIQEQRLAQENREREDLKANKRKAEQELREREMREKLARDKKLELAQQKVRQDKKDADDKKVTDLRKQQMDRMNRLANQATGSGENESSGSAKQSSGPSASYGGRIRARIKPNITYTESLSNNPAAEVEVRTSPDGTIISRKLTKPSGVRSWDDAVLQAIDKTEVLPRDIDGRVPPTLTLVFRPKD